MNLQSTEKIDVCQSYFNIDSVPIEKYASIVDVNVDILVNRTISKTAAVCLIGKKRCMDGNNLASSSISYEQICIDMVKDFMDQRIFAQENARCCGWLLQYDPTPFANWYHDCFYYFVVNHDSCQVVKHNRGLSDTIRMQKIFTKTGRVITNEKMCDSTFWWH